MRISVVLMVTILSIISVFREPASTPPPLRNGPGGPIGMPGQLTVGTPMSASKGPSPNMMRRGKVSRVPVVTVTNRG